MESIDKDCTDRIFDPVERSEEKNYEVILRPQGFDHFIGQKKVVDNVKIMVKSALIRKGAMDHVLLSGPPGLGKTSLAMILANELGSHLHLVSGPAIEKKGDLAALLTNLSFGDVLFIDEIHRLNIAVEEILYSAMEDYRLDIVIGQGTAARTMQINIEPFTLIGATTRAGLLSNPLRTRFLANLHFDFYEVQDLVKILLINSKKMNLFIDNDSLSKMATCARGTPRIANRILRRVRDFCLVKGHDYSEPSDVLEALELMEIDQAGLDRMDRKIMQVMKEYYGGGPVGIDALCATLAEDRTTIEDVYEPYLLKEGYIIRTPRGRLLSEKGMNHQVEL